MIKGSLKEYYQKKALGITHTSACGKYWYKIVEDEEGPITYFWDDIEDVWRLSVMKSTWLEEVEDD